MVRDSITSSCPSVVCLQETKLATLSSFKLGSFLPAFYNDHAFTPSEGTVGGILVAWDTRCFAGQVVATHQYHVTVKLTSTTSASSLLLTVVYAPCVNTERGQFFEAVASVAVEANTPWIVLGDFNMYRFAHEK